MIQKADQKLKNQIREIFIENWGTDFMISRGKIHHVSRLDSFVYSEEDVILGMLTFSVDHKEMEIVSLDSFYEEIGIGTALLQAAIDYYKQNKLERLWLITTNDNLNALKFYQKRGFTITNIYKNAVNEARRLKPSIPFIGYNNIPILHEIELMYDFKLEPIK